MAKVLKAIINPITLAMTCFLVIYELTAITEDPIFKVGLFIGAVTIELIIQYDLALALAYFRLKGAKNKLKGCALLLFFGWYVVVFALLAGIGFFKAEIDAKESTYQTTEITKSFTVQRITEINKTLEILNKQLETEAETGYGPRSRMLMEQVNKLSAERKELQESLSKVDNVAAGKKNLFGSLKDVFGWSENFFKVLIFGTMIIILYLGQILTAWHVTVTIPGVTVTDETVKHVTKKLVTRNKVTPE